MENYYQQFLGIQGVSRPDYYTLLGVQPKEKDSAIITDAAQKRIQQLETQKTPENETAITQILSEITTARDCLLDEKARKQYEFLRLLNESVAEKNASENVTLEKRSAENDGSTGSTTSSATSGMASTMPSGMSAGMPNYVQNLTPQAVPDPTFQAMQMNSAPGMMPGIPQQGMAPNMFMPGMIPGGAPGMAPVQPQGMPQPGIMPGMVPEMDPNTAALRGVSGFQPQPEITSVQQLGMPQPGIMPGMVPEMDPNTAALRGVSGFQPQPEITSVQQLGMSQQQVQPEPISQPENGLDFGATGFGTTSTSARTTTSPTARRKNTGGKSTSKTSARGKDNTPIVIGSVAGVILILIALGIYSGNTDTARAKKLYIEAQSAVNELNFDRGRELMDCALELETTVEYENYRKSIDIKQKKYEKRLRHEAARQADDFDI